MTDKLKNIIQEEVMKLPKEGREAIGSLDWVSIAEEIGKKYLLDENEINNFQVETLLVLVGITDPEFYAVNVENQVGTTKDVAEKITSEVLQKIFAPVYENLTENIKNSGKVGSGNAKQNLNFILSGGDYSAFLPPSPLQGEGRGEVNSESVRVPPPLDKGRTEERSLRGELKTPSLADIQEGVQKRDIEIRPEEIDAPVPARSAFSTADAGGPVKPKKMDDIKSKFTI